MKAKDIHKTTYNGNVAVLVATALVNLCWPDCEIPHEDKFNRELLVGYLRTVEGLQEIKEVEQHTLRRSEARPFFGWGGRQPTNEGAPASINKKVKTDLTFQLATQSFFVENKIIRKGNECEIKNSLVQAVEYLNLYNVALGILLVFDAGRGDAAEWGGGPEKQLIDAITNCYPMIVARIRKKGKTEIFVKSGEAT